MKKILVIVAGVLASLIMAGAIFKEPLLAAVKETITADMFVNVDDDDFDVGLALNADFPEIKALSKGELITQIQPLIGDKGMIFIANRSVDW